MGTVRGLQTRLCPKCNDMTPHRTLYAKTESAGRSRWFQLFWACAKCGSLNHVVLPRYRLEHPSFQLSSDLAIAVVTSLQDGPLDIEQLLTKLRGRQIPGLRHIFKSEVVMVLEYLKGRGVVVEDVCDRTMKTLDILRNRSAQSVHLGPCPAELALGVEARTLVSLYAQRTVRSNDGTNESALQRRFVPIGVFCLRCQYRSLKADSMSEISRLERQTAIPC